jgi:hypothetical protein
MKMDGLTVKFDLEEFVDMLSDEARQELGRIVAAHEPAFEAIADALVTGSWFDDDAGYWWSDNRRVEKLREKLLPLMDTVAGELCRELIRQRDRAEMSMRDAERMAWKLYHAWPDDRWQDRPNTREEFIYASAPPLRLTMEMIKKARETP